jgi:hypothetical protein
MTAMPRLPEFRLREQIETSLQWSHDRTFSGYVVDTADPGRTFVVELVIGGYPVKCMRADNHVAALAARGIGNGCHGFAFSLAEDALQGDELIEVRIANLGTAVGEPISLRTPGAPAARSEPPSCGAVRWLGGLRLSGWIAEADDPTVDIFVDGDRIERVRAAGWGHIGGIEDPRPVRTFEYTLPGRFADGATRHFAATNIKGEQLEGSRQPFFAAANGIRRGNAVVRSRAAVIIVGAGEFDATLQTLERQSHADWVAASLPGVDGHADFDSRAAQAFLAGEAAEAAFVVFLLSGARLHEAALMRLADAFAKNTRLAAVYGDVDIRAFALRRSAAERALGTGACGLYQLLDAILDDKSQPAEAVAYLPDAVAVLTSLDPDAAASHVAAADPMPGGVAVSSRIS